MSSKCELFIKNDVVTDFFSLLFTDNHRIKVVDDSSVEIETDKFFTTALVLNLNDNQYTIQVDLPDTYSLKTDSTISERVETFSYFQELFLINPFLFHFDKVKRVIFEINRGKTLLKLIFGTSFGINGVLCFAPDKHYLSLNGVIIHLKQKESQQDYYNEIFNRFFSDKKFGSLLINGVKADRIHNFMSTQLIQPTDFMDEHLEVIKMEDY